MLLTVLTAIVFHGFSVSVGIEIAFIVLLLCMSAFASGSETAFFSLSPKDFDELEEKAKEDNSAAAAVLALREEADNLLATVLITNNFINVAIVVVSALTLQSLFDFSNSPVWGFIIETVAITFILLLFGEIIPKIVATHYPLSITLRCAKPLKTISKVMKPFAMVLVKSTSLIRSRMAKNGGNNLSMDELQSALEITSDTTSEDKELLEGIVRFGNISAGSIMTSRLDMVAIDVKCNFKAVLEIIEETGYSRIPVYDGTHDNIKGVLYIKDLIPHLTKGNTFRWQTLIRPATFVPETRKIDDLLQDFQRLRVHIAIVVDEFGGTLGIITMEDVLEEIVGDISDEYDEEEHLYEKMNDDSFLFEAKIQLNDFFKIVDVEPELLGNAVEEAETLAGLLLYVSGDMPKQRAKIVLGPCTFVVLNVNRRRILKVKTIIDRNYTKPDEEA